MQVLAAKREFKVTIIATTLATTVAAVVTDYKQVATAAAIHYCNIITTKIDHTNFKAADCIAASFVNYMGSTTIVCNYPVGMG